jgi:hypothetical protein
MSSVAYYIQSLASFLYPFKRAIFLSSFIVFVFLLIELFFLQSLENHLSIPLLLLFLWGLLFYIFINLFANSRNVNPQKTTLLTKIKNKLAWFVHSFFIIVFIVLFFFSVFYSYKVLNV